MQADPYGYWREALAGEFAGWRDDPSPGFYRMKVSRSGGWLPIAIWLEADELHCLKGCGTAGTLVPAWSVWTSCSWNPTTEAAYRAKCEGRPYPDEFQVRGSSETTIDVVRVSPIGPPEDEE